MIQYAIYLLQSAIVITLLVIGYKQAHLLRNFIRPLDVEPEEDNINLKEMESKIGIYKIGFKGTDEVFIGQSLDLANSLKFNKEQLKEKRHYNKKLQTSYNKHGVRRMQFDVLQYCEESSLDYLERYYVNKFNMLYNGLATSIKDTDDED